MKPQVVTVTIRGNLYSNDFNQMVRDSIKQELDNKPSK